MFDESNKITNISSHTVARTDRFDTTDRHICLNSSFFGRYYRISSGEITFVSYKSTVRPFEVQLEKLMSYNVCYLPNG